MWPYPATNRQPRAGVWHEAVFSHVDDGGLSGWLRGQRSEYRATAANRKFFECQPERAVRIFDERRGPEFGGVRRPDRQPGGGRARAHYVGTGGRAGSGKRASCIAGDLLEWDLPNSGQWTRPHHFERDRRRDSAAQRIVTIQQPWGSGADRWIGVGERGAGISDAAAVFCKRDQRKVRV